MAINYLHGIESLEIPDGVRSVRAIKSSVIGLVGTAPMWQVAPQYRTVNEIRLISNTRDAAQFFGSDLPGYTIPEALNAIFEQGGADVLVVNVFDPATHVAPVVDEAVTFSAKDAASLSRAGVSTVVVKDTAGTTTYTAGTDYEVTAAGVLTRKAGGAIPTQATVKVSYSRANPAAVAAGAIIGEVTPDGQYRGLHVFETAFAKLGMFPKILIAPHFSEVAAVAAALRATAHDVRAQALIDAPQGWTVQQALEGRGDAAGSPFATSDQRAILCYPRVQCFDPATNGIRLEPLSSRLAGVKANKDREEGYWVSPSNTEIKGVLGTERLLTARLNHGETDVNHLNEAGIVTVFNSWGTGFRVWGNRTAAWPTETHPKNFIAVRRIADMIQESIEFSMLPYLDRPLTPALIDHILESGNSYLRTMVGRGALVDGRMFVDPAKNPPTQIALGHLIVNADYMPTPPLDRLTTEHYLDTSLLKKLFGTSN